MHIELTYRTLYCSDTRLRRHFHLAVCKFLNVRENINNKISLTQSSLLVVKPVAFNFIVTIIIMSRPVKLVANQVPFYDYLATSVILDFLLT